MPESKLTYASKRLTISDSSLNTFGFRMLTSGADLSRLEANPVLLFCHERSGSKYANNTAMPIGLVTDIKVEGDKITCLPAFDPDDELAMKVYKKYEKGILRMASVGAEPIEESTEPAVMLPGQTRPTLTKWLAMEVSIVDIGANANALSLYGKDGRIQLSASNIDNFLPIINSETMKLTAQVVLALALTDNYTEAQVNEAVVKLAAKVTEAETKLQASEQKATTLEGEKQALSVQLSDQKVNALIDAAVTSGKITEKQKPHYVTLATANYDTTKALLDDIAAHTPISQQLSAGGGGAKNAKEAEWLKLSFKELDKMNKLAWLKANHPDVYKEKFEEDFPQA